MCAAVPTVGEFFSSICSGFLFTSGFLLTTAILLCDHIKGGVPFYEEHYNVKCWASEDLATSLAKSAIPREVLL